MTTEYLRIGSLIYRLSDTVLSVKEIWRAIQRLKKKNVEWEAIAKKLNRRGARTAWQKKPWTKESTSNFYRSHKDKFLLRSKLSCLDHQTVEQVSIISTKQSRGSK